MPPGRRWAIILPEMTPRRQSTGNGRPGRETEADAPVSPRVPENCRVYAIGDIHGRADLLGRLHGQILDDAKTAPDLRKVVVYVGDYIDRGPDSFDVIDGLIERPLEGFERHTLKGNHEDMMMAFLETGTHGETWIMNGGRNTLDSYGIGLWDLLSDLRDLQKARDKLRQAIPESHWKFLTGLEMHHTEGDYLFVHAGLRPGVSLRDQNEFDLMWIREEFLYSDADLGHLVVHGHTSCPEPKIRPNRIAIDTGAWRSNRLTALVLEADTRRFLST